MPRPNEHVCDIRPTEGYDRVRNEPEDSDNPMYVDEKRVYRTYGFKDDTSEILMYRFPRDEGWDDATQTARSWCNERDGSFEPMSGETEASILYTSDAAQSFTKAQVMANVTGEAAKVWHPLIPLGKFYHPVYGEFETTEEDAREMIANFEAGIPTNNGIPIDENANHARRAAGAYGWITALELRDDTLWAAIKWTDDGKEAVESDKLPYISAHWNGAESVHPTYDQDNVIVAAALCTRPFFYDQPELRVATTEYLRGEEAAIAAEQEAARMTGARAQGDDDKMAEDLAIQARTVYEKAYGEVTDDEWDEVAEDLESDEDIEAFIAALGEGDGSEGEGDGGESDDEGGDTDELATLREQVEEATKEAKAAEEKLAEAEKRAKEAEAEKQDLAARIEALEKDKERTELESELAATTLDGNRRYSPEAVELMATVELEPSPENVAALKAHIEENDGSVATVPMGESPTITATTDEGELTGDAWLEAKNIPDGAKKATRQIAQKQDVPLETAYGIYLDRQIR